MEKLETSIFSCTHQCNHVIFFSFSADGPQFVLVILNFIITNEVCPLSDLLLHRLSNSFFSMYIPKSLLSGIFNKAIDPYIRIHEYREKLESDILERVLL